MNPFGLITPLVLTAVLGLGPANAGALPIGWNDLRPANQPEWIMGVTDKATDAPEGDVLSMTLKAQAVELSGFLLPVDQEGDMVYEALLVPEPGGCSHTAQPPANQLVHVFANPPYKLHGLYEPVKVSGLLRPGIESLQVIIVDGVTTLDAGYRLSQAKVEHTRLRPKSTLPKSADTPWNFLRK